MITSTSNVQVKNIAALLKKGKERQAQGAFVIEGRKMFEEAMRDGLLQKAYFSETYFKENYETQAPSCAYEVLSDAVFASTAETVTPQGVLAIVKMPEYRLEQMLNANAPLLLLEDIRDPGNLGTMLRTAEAAGVGGVILSREAVDIYNPKVIRSTMGAVFRVPFLYADDFIGLLSLLKKEGVHVLAAHLKGTKNYNEADYSGRVGILIGNEANGLSEEAANLAEEKVLIPMAGEVESLNAAVAAALLMYEAARSRW